FLFIKSAALHKKRTQAEEKTSALLATEGDVVKSCISEVKQSINSMLDIYEKNIVGLTSEDRKLLKQNSSDADDLYLKYKNKRTYEVVPTIQTIAIKELEIEQEYVQIVDYTYEITKALKMITNDSYRYIDNNHKGFSDEQEEDLRALNDRVVEMFESFIKLMNETDYNAFRTVVIKHREDILEMYAKLTKKQIKRVKAGLSGTRSSILFLNILNETKNIVLQAVNLMKSQRDMMLLQNGKKDAPKVIEPKI
ncbi:MAG: inorganic phosphate transporter, partial [Petrimonas sp.]|nr:inorganic phosphate transporter [Petrimonas sp.]